MSNIFKRLDNYKTVIIMMSTYNGERYLDEQLESIYKQKAKVNVELYIRDDGSSDKTLQIIDRWRKSLNIKFIQGKNLGPAKSFWELMQNVPLDADFYAFSDQDDVWDSDKIECAICSLEGSIIPTLYFANSRMTDENLNYLNYNTLIKEPILTIPSQIVCGNAQGCTMMFNKEAMLGLRNLNVRDIPMHDWIVMLHVLATGKVIYDPIPRMSYRQHANNVIGKSNKTMYQKIKMTYRLWTKNSKKHPIRVNVIDLLENYEDILELDLKQYLYWLANCKKNIIYKIRLIFDNRTNSISTRALISYKIRIFLGLI